MNLLFYFRTYSWDKVYFLTVLNATKNIIGITVFFLLLFIILKKIYEKLHRLKLFEKVIVNSSLMIMIVDPETEMIREVSNEAIAFFGYSKEEILNLKLSEIISLPEKVSCFSETSSFSPTPCFYPKIPFKQQNNMTKTLDIHKNLIILQKRAYVCLNIYDVTEESQLKDDLYYLIYHDELTGLYNRRYLKKELARLNEAQISPVSIVMIDMDRLKQVNDTYGHQIGDQYIQAAAQILKNSTGKSDLIARIGGDEFVIISTGKTQEEIIKLCNQIETKCLKEKRYHQKFGTMLQLSMGYSTKEDRSKDLEDVWVEADQNMYLAKKRVKKGDTRRSKCQYK